MWTPSHVRVTVHRAKNLLGKGKNGKNDTFVVIQLKKEKFHTSVKEMTVNPEWHEECDLAIPNGRSNIAFTVLHRNIIGIDLFLGELTIPLSDFDIYERPKSKWYILESKASKKHKPPKDRGAIEIKFEFIVKDTQLLSTPLFEKKNKTNSLVNIASDVGAKLSAKFPSRRLSLKLGKKFKENEELDWRRDSMSEESSISSSKPDFDLSNDNFCIDSEPTTPKIGSDSRFYQRSQSIAVLPIKSAQLVPSIQTFDEDMNSVFESKYHVQSMEDIRNPNLLSSKREKSGSMSNLNSTRPFLSPSYRSKTEPHSIITKTINDKISAEHNKPSLENKKSSSKLLLKPCYEDEPILTISNQSKISRDVMEAYGALNREELLNTIVTQKLVIENQRNKMKDMESYIDNLLVRVMNTMPKLLQTPIVQYSSKSSR